ncbi:cellulose binding domain-containing protein [Mycobacterium pseudokansasii]|uniref:cellulose binding domain-containing protein n=1 Tax=Mycobacterium pseudokansasii TaxID=2341080 RepID=UPI0024530205|nr:cellulose binding domain-containing protein [Mycobacterium pseudokansasii]
MTAVPEALAAAAREITGIGSTLSAANAAAAAPTTGLLAAGADEVSAAIAGLFSSHAREYQALSAQAVAFHEQFVTALTASARSYLSTEAANIAPLRNVVQGLLGMIGAPTAGNGGQAVATGAGGHGGSSVASSGSSGSGTGGGTAAVSGQYGSAAPVGTGATGAAAPGPSSAGPSTASGTTATTTAAATTAAAPAGTDTDAGGTAAVNPTTAAPTSTASGTTALATAAATTTSTGTTTASTGGTGVTATYTPTAQWNSGFTANYTITNTGTTPLTNWQLQFDLPTNESVTNLWNGQVSQSGTHYTVTPASYNGTIEPGNSVTVGFQAAQNGSYSPPTHLLVNGQPVGGDTGGTGTGTSTGGTGTGGTTTSGTGTGSTGGTGTGSTGGTGTGSTGSTGGTGTGSTGGTGTGSTGTGGTGTGGTGTGGTGTGGTGTGGSGITATYAPTSQWNNGFVANYTITNTGTTPVTDWQLQFDLPSNESITNLWNGQVAQSGTHYTVTPQSYDATIAPGSSVTVGFQAAQTGSYASPTNLLVNGQPVTGAGTGGTGTGTGGTGTGTGGTGTGGTGTGGTGTGGTGTGGTGTGTGGTGTGGTGTGTGGTLITSQYGTTTIQNAYVVQNNAWNNPGGQSINVTPTGFSIATENGSAPTNGAPLGYPSIYDGWHYGTGSPGTNLPIQLGQIQTATSSINYTYPSTGIYNASYDIWLNPTPITTGVNQQEVMIWFNHQGPIQPVGSVVGNATIDGQNFQVWKGSNGQNNVVSYVATTPITSWNNFDVMEFIDNTQTLEPVTDSWYLTSIQAGFEPWSGSVGAGVDSFSALVNGV